MRLRVNDFPRVAAGQRGRLDSIPRLHHPNHCAARHVVSGVYYQEGREKVERDEVRHGQDVSTCMSVVDVVVEDLRITTLTRHRRQHQHDPVVQRGASAT